MSRPDIVEMLQHCEIKKSDNNYTKDRDQSSFAYRPNTDPKSTYVFLFPDYAKQDFINSKYLLKYKPVQQLFSQASEILGFDTKNLLENQSIDFINSHILLFLVSMSYVEKLNAVENCVAASGLNIGEYSALVFSGSLDFEIALQLIKLRAEEIFKISQNMKFGIMTVKLLAESQLNIAIQKAKEYCLEQGIQNPLCHVSTYLFPQCKILSGHLEAINFIQQNSHIYKIPHCVKLENTYPTNSPNFKPIISILQQAFMQIDVKPPLIPVYSNVTSHRMKYPEQIKKLLCMQLIKPIKWEQCLHVIYERPQDTPYPNTIECGPGGTLGSLLKLNNLKAYLNYSKA